MTHNAENDVTVETVEYAHRWFEHGRWFYGFGSSMDPHICGEAGTVCEWRERTITASPWSDWGPAAPTPCEDCEQGVMCDEHRTSALPLHRTEAGYPRCSTCDGGGCPDCTDPA